MASKIIIGISTWKYKVRDCRAVFLINERRDVGERWDKRAESACVASREEDGKKQGDDDVDVHDEHDELGPFPLLFPFPFRFVWGNLFCVTELGRETNGPLSDFSLIYGRRSSCGAKQHHNWKGDLPSMTTVGRGCVWTKSFGKVIFKLT